MDPYLHVAGTIALAILYPLLPQTLRRWLLLAASYLFYAAINVAFVPILFGISLISYVGGFAVERWPWTRMPGTLTIVLLLMPLVFYKYWEAWFGTMILPGIPVSALQFGAQSAVLIPVGLSFYTFQAIGYVIDVQRKAVTADHNFVRFFLFKSFFPLLLAGPIERYKSLAPQLWGAPLPRLQAIGPALLLMFYGLFMKAVIGDRMGATVDEAYLASAPGFQHALIATAGFTTQIFADFAGYSLIAVGSAQLFGVDVTRNFKQPFFSHNLVEFWQRWHISLTRWIGDYLYRPLGRLFWRWTKGNQPVSESLTALIVWTVMGLWHGPTAQFVLFGMLQAVAMQAIKLMGPDRPAMLPPWRLGLGMALTFGFVCLTFGLIRTPGVAEYGSMLSALASFAPGRAIIVQRDILWTALAAMIAVEAVRRFWPQVDITRSPAIVYPLIFVLFLTVILLGYDQSRDFVYFRF